MSGHLKIVGDRPWREPISGVVRVFTRQVYGTPMIYPANHEADVLCKLTGKSTLSSRDLDLIRSIGFQVEEVHDPKLKVSA